MPRLPRIARLIQRQSALLLLGAMCALSSPLSAGQPLRAALDDQVLMHRKRRKARPFPAGEAENAAPEQTEMEWE